MKHLNFLFLILILLVPAGFVQGQTFTNAVTNGNPNPFPIRCDGQFGLRMDDGDAANVEEATAIWCNSDLINLNQSFDIEFDIRFGDVTAADGMTFTLQRQGLTAIGGGGGFLGVQGDWNGVGSISPSVNVEFDIFNNGNNTLGDGIDDHVAISYNGDLANPQFAASAIPLNNGTWHHMLVTWDACAQILTVTMDGVVVARLTDDLVSNVFGGNAAGVIFGFTSATWNNNTPHDLCFTSYRAFDCCENIPNPRISFATNVPCTATGCCVSVNISHGTTAQGSVIYDWGDGTTSYSNYHTYNNPGIYTVTAFVQYHLLDDPSNCCTKTTRRRVRVNCTGDSFKGSELPTNIDNGSQTKSTSALFPNPIEKGDELTLQLEETPTESVNFIIMNMEGKRILNFKSSGTSKIDIRLPDNMSSGLYMLTSDNESIPPHKFFVKN